MPSIPLPVVNWGKRKTRSQMGEVFTIDGRIADIEFPVNRGCMQDDENANGFMINSANLYYNENDKNWTQLIDERDGFPISPRIPQDRSKFQDQVEQLFVEVEGLTIAEQFKKGKNDKMTPFMIIVAMACTTVMIVAAIVYFGS